MEEWGHQSFTHRNPIFFKGLYLESKEKKLEFCPASLLLFS